MGVVHIRVNLLKVWRMSGKNLVQTIVKTRHGDEKMLFLVKNRSQLSIFCVSRVCNY